MANVPSLYFNHFLGATVASPAIKKIKKYDRQNHFSLALAEGGTW